MSEELYLPKVTRVEVIGDGTRFVNYYDEPGLTLSVQDEGRTLKVLVGYRGE